MVSCDLLSNSMLFICIKLLDFLLEYKLVSINKLVRYNNIEKRPIENILSISNHIFSAMDINFPEPVQKLIEETSPKLIDQPTLYYLDGALKKSHNIRIKYHRIILNVGIVCALGCLVGGFLYYRYKTRPTQQDANYKLIKDQEYVLSKIRYFQEQNQRINESSRTAIGSEISGLPVVHPNS